VSVATNRPPAPATVLETATALSISVHTVRAWIAKRKIGHLKLGRSIRVPWSEVDRLRESGYVPPVRPTA
jgi:excisionase family DNA binding protein